MQDANGNGIPDRIDRIIFGLLTLLTAAGGAALQVLTPAPQWLRVALVVLPVLSGYVALKGRPGGGTAASLVAALLAGGLIIGASGCKGPLHAAATTTLAVAQARNTVDDATATAFRAQVVKCTTSSGADACPDSVAAARKDAACQAALAKYKACVEGSKVSQWMRKWQKYIRPSVNASIRLAHKNLAQAVVMDQEPGPEWIGWLKGAVCGIADAAPEFKDLVDGPTAEAVLRFLAVAKGVTCVR